MSRTDPEYTTISCDLVYASNAALLIRGADDIETWVPRSGVRDGESWPVGTREETGIELDIAVWLAEREGLV